MKRLAAVYFLGVALIIGWGIHRDLVQRQPCLQLYGGSDPSGDIRKTVERSDDFLLCESENNSLAFGAQFYMICGVCGWVLFVTASFAAYEKLSYWWQLRD